MIKFGGTDVADIEICGSALKPLPMYLNRQLIKILEDLHVPDQAFLALQADAVETLRMTTQSAINAASFLERNFVGKAARLPWLVRKLWAMGFSFADDDFLRDTLELAVLIQLREIKHRSRIRVEKGVTLYGTSTICACAYSLNGPRYHGRDRPPTGGHNLLFFSDGKRGSD